MGPAGASAAAVALAAALAVAGARGATAEPLPPAPACTNAGTQAAVYATELGGMSHRAIMITLTNTSTLSCEVGGYPRPQMLDAGHRLILPQSVRNGPTYFSDDPGVHTIRLSPGDRVSALLVWGDLDGATTAKPSYLAIGVPGTDISHSVPWTPDAVANGDLNVTALARHIPIDH